MKLEISNLNKIAWFSRTNMKFSHFIELITINKPTDEFYLEISYIFSYSRFYWFCFNKVQSLKSLKSFVQSLK